MLAAVERVSGVLYFRVVQMSTFGEGSQGGEETAATVVTSSNTQWVSFRDCWEDRSASQDVKMNGTIGVSSLVQQLRHCLITDACG